VTERPALDRALLWQLVGLGVLAFLFRLVPVLLSGGLTGMIDYDDGVYMGTALALVRGRIVYRDFYMLHPPGIVYTLTPFAMLSWFFSDATAFGAARFGFMILGGINTFLVGMVARRFGRTAALASAALYAVWLVVAKVERSTWLVSPQNTVELLALLALAPTLPGPGAIPITWRRAAVVGILIGIAGTIQIWGIVTAAVIFAWLFVRTFRQPGGWLRPVAAYAIAGFATIAVLFLPFFLEAPTKMIRIVIFDQIGRAEAGVGILARLRQMEGFPHALVSRFGLEYVPLGIFVIVMAIVLVLAWRRPETRLWVALFVAQSLFLLKTPSFFGHYAAWMVPAAALCAGMALATALGWAATRPRIRQALKAAYGVGLAGYLFMTLAPAAVGFPVASHPFDTSGIRAAIANARCPTSDSPSVLILTGTMERLLDNGCPLLVSPSGVSYDTDANLTGRARNRPNQPEYQAYMQSYFGGSDAAIFVRNPKNMGFTQATWNVILAHLPRIITLPTGRVYVPSAP
jgi:alpha-1,2-mannosyltransferase